MFEKNSFSPKETARLFRDREAVMYVTDQDLSYNENVKQNLAKLAQEQGLDAQQAAVTAAKIVDTISAYKSISQQISENPVRVINEVFEELDALEPQMHMDVLNQMYFSLLLYTDADLTAQLKAGTSAQTLYNNFRSQSQLSEEYLRAGILEKATDATLTPDAVDLITASVARTFDESDFAENTEELPLCTTKAVVALRLYLNSQDSQQPLTPEEAAAKACFDSDIKGLGNALLAGGITKVVVLGIFLALILAITLLFAKILIANVFATNPSILLPLVCCVCCLSAQEVVSFLGGKVAPLAGQAAAAAVPAVKEGIARFREAMGHVREAAEEKHVQAPVHTQAPVVEEDVVQQRPLTAFI